MPEVKISSAKRSNPAGLVAGLLRRLAPRGDPREQNVI
jgi:hypothetical protein